MEPHSISVDDDLHEAAKKVTVSFINSQFLVLLFLLLLKSFNTILTLRLCLGENESGK